VADLAGKLVVIEPMAICQVLSPPSTPKVIVTPAGEIIGPQFGVADAEAVEQELLSHLG
jgi:hypothetical protein